MHRKCEKWNDKKQKLLPKWFSMHATEISNSVWHYVIEIAQVKRITYILCKRWHTKRITLKRLNSNDFDSNEVQIYLFVFQYVWVISFCACFTQRKPYTVQYVRLPNVISNICMEVFFIVVKYLVFIRLY